MYLYLNLNPKTHTDDCAVRAVALALDMSWKKAYLELALQGVDMNKMPNDKSVVNEYLKSRGFTRHTMPECPECITVKEFSYNYDKGTYILGLLDHIVTMIDGIYYDTWDSGNESVIYYWSKEK